MSPFLAWVMATRYERWESSGYLPAGLAIDFVPPGFNWIFLKTLELSENPGDWLSAAEANAEHWIYIVTDSSIRRRLHEIDPLWIVSEFPEWEPRVLLWEEQQWITPESVLWTAVMARDKVGLLLMRKSDKPTSMSLSGS